MPNLRQRRRPARDWYQVVMMAWAPRGLRNRVLSARTSWRWWRYPPDLDQAHA